MDFDIAVILIFVAAVASVLWGMFNVYMIRRVDMTKVDTIEKCIELYAKSADLIEKIGGEKQAPAQEVLDLMKLVGVKITEGAKAFLNKEYLYLIIWTISFAILLGCTVDLLEMQATTAPSNFPYTAVAFTTGSFTSILAGYIGMRVAVYTNTRVTFQCTDSVHKGFVTAFRGGQVLGFVLVGLGVLNIMIIIMIFKAGWYDYYIKSISEAGFPYDNCPSGDYAGS
jgi:hypothetical protein